MAQTSDFAITEFFIFLQVQHLTNLPTISQSIRQLTEFTEKICGPRDKTLILREQARHFFVRFAPGKIPQKNLSGKVSRNPTHSRIKSNQFRHHWAQAQNPRPGWTKDSIRFEREPPGAYFTSGIQAGRR